MGYVDDQEPSWVAEIDLEEPKIEKLGEIGGEGTLVNIEV